MLLQGREWSASKAARTARSTSPGEAAGINAQDRSVDGSTLSKVAAASSKRPLMYWWKVLVLTDQPPTKAGMTSSMNSSRDFFFRLRLMPLSIQKL